MWKSVLTGALTIACIAMAIVLTRGDPLPGSIIASSLPQPVTTPTTAASIMSNVRANEGVLSRRISELDLDTSDLQSAFQTLSAKTRTNFDVDWMALRGMKIDRTTPIHIHLWDVTLDQALRAILDNAAVSDRHGGPAYEVQDGLVRVPGARTSHAVTAMYDIKDLINAIIDADVEHRDGKLIALSHYEAADKLMHLIADSVGPDSWRDAGGTVGAESELAGLLVVTQTPENQIKIAALLGQLRAGGVKIASATQASPSYAVVDGFVPTSSPDDPVTKTTTVLYDAKDLIDATINGSVEQRHGKLVVLSRDEAVQKLRDFLTASVAPDSWRDVGGIVGDVRELTGVLVVTQTPENQARVAALLSQLRGGGVKIAPATQASPDVQKSDN